ncbi:MAG: hypothetical protein QXD55_01615 [Candidatus Aenigmatarchaeota archaeon]
MLILLLFFLEFLFVLGILNIISWNLVLAFSVMYLFINGLIIELKEIRIKEDLKAKIAEKLEKIEKSIIGSKEKIESDERVKQRLSAKKREIIEWLNKL